MINIASLIYKLHIHTKKKILQYVLCARQGYACIFHRLLSSMAFAWQPNFTSQFLPLKLVELIPNFFSDVLRYVWIVSFSTNWKKSTYFYHNKPKYELSGVSELRSFSVSDIIVISCFFFIIVISCYFFCRSSNLHVHASLGLLS